MANALKRIYPWTHVPIVVSAPMRVFAGPQLAVMVHQAGGLGFIGPTPKPTDLEESLAQARILLNLQHHQSLPLGVGFQTFDADISIAIPTLKKHRPSAVWLFAARKGQEEFDIWIERIKEVSPDTQIWIQVGSVRDAVAASRARIPPDVLVVQGIDAGGHGLEKGAGIISLVPEVVDAVKSSGIPVFAAGGIVDGRGIAAALGLGAAGAVMGTRFLASNEAKIPKGYQNDILRISDGGQTTVRTKLYDQMAGRADWPEAFDGRNIVNRTIIDDESGMDRTENASLYKAALGKGDEGWGVDGRLTGYMGSGVGLIREVRGAGEIVQSTREEAIAVLKGLNSGL